MGYEGTEQRTEIQDPQGSPQAGVLFVRDVHAGRWSGCTVRLWHERYHDGTRCFLHDAERLWSSGHDAGAADAAVPERAGMPEQL